ncbi:MAG: thioredoxin family protein [Candidatus Marinimicrobia bacterium]|nr:thioredoxin family protein [Candidatus Neomarinimicrobiota bacterium]
MEVKILGVGCPKCKALEAKVRDVANQNGIEIQVEKITQIDKIMNYGIMMTPGLVVNGKVVSSGKIPTTEQILNWLKEN